MTKNAVRTSYYIFCCRNKEWENPKLFTLLNTFLIYTYLHVSLFFNV